MTTKTATHVYEDVFQNLRKAAEANLKMQKDILHQWAALWPGVPQTESAWLDKIRDFQKQWANTVSELAHSHRQTIDRQYDAALESLDEVLRFGESTNVEELRDRTEQLYRKTLECVREVSEIQLKEFQDAVTKFGELMAKKSE